MSFKSRCTSTNVFSTNRDSANCNCNAIAVFGVAVSSTDPKHVN